MIASRVAAQLRKEDDVEVEVAKGGLLELSVYIDDHKVVETNPLWYPRPSRLVRTTRELLTKGQVGDESARRASNVLLGKDGVH
jgi:hypothetical protein